MEHINEEIAKHTKFTLKEVNSLHEKFRRNIPIKGITKETFRRNIPICGITEEKFIQVFFNITDHRFPKILQKQLFSIFDKNKNGYVSFEELMYPYNIMCHGTRQEKLQLAFAIFDLDNNGYISEKELVIILTNMYKEMDLTDPPFLACNTAKDIMGIGKNKKISLWDIMQFVENPVNDREVFFNMIQMSTGMKI